MHIECAPHVAVKVGENAVMVGEECAPNKMTARIDVPNGMAVRNGGEHAVKVGEECAPNMVAVIRYGIE